MSIPRALILFLIVMAGACSGSGGISGSGNLATGNSVGPIDGFGSVIVNGQRFDTNTAKITIEGQPATQDDLRVGQVIAVSGDLSALVADTITYRPEIKGVVTSVVVEDPTVGQGTLIVLGQTVRVDAQTVFDGTSFALLSAGDLLEVSGPRNANGSVVATFVQSKSTLDEYKLVGTVTNTMPTTRTFTIGGLTVDALTADVGDLPGDPATWNGLVVEAKGDAIDFTAATNTIIASKVEPVHGPTLDTGSGLELEGFITDFVSAAQFEVLGFDVRTTPSTVFINGESASLADNVKVQLRGNIASDGVLEASSCEIRSTGAIRTRGDVSVVDVANGIVTVLGVQWEVRPETELEDDSDAELDPFTLLDLAPGDQVEIRGYLDGTQVVASFLERENEEDDTSLRGPVSSIDDIGNFRVEILGTLIHTDGNTEYRDENDAPMTQQAFFQALELGTFVSAKWEPFLGLDLPVDELSIEDDD
jgi:hypothetical protein